ncbi:MAG: thiamine pyrophosphate-dependent dehydrogenase E1 component subunit alpha [Chloroflexi bacterium]|nr:thiamine pyrophosphate-dependent dehydrogenase E1 component subunit alpha [Chloroflexota bacterium]
MEPTGNVAATTERPRHRELGLGDDAVRGAYHTMVRVRMLADRLWILNRQGKVAVVHTQQGHEATQVGAMLALRPGVDWLVPYYRDLGMIMALGMTAGELLMAYFAKAPDPSSGGRQMPGHWSSPRLRIVSGSSVIATQLPHAVGVALSLKVKGEDAVVVTCFGDGASSAGDFHEALNFASVQKLPVIFICENNGYALSVPQSKQMVVRNVSERAAAYGILGITADGNDLLTVYERTRAAVELARVGEGPSLLEFKTYRYTPHSADDDDTIYRSREEVDSWRRERDPIDRFRNYLVQAGLWSDDAEAALRQEIETELAAGIEAAERAAYPPAESIGEQLYAE